MITIKDMNERWLNEVKDYIIDSTIREYNIAYWDFLTSQVDNLEYYYSDRKDALAFDVKNMGYADYDEVNKAFKKLGHEDLDAQDFSEDIYEICQFDNETIFHDIEDYLEVPFYAMGRMGGHWGVLCEDVCDKYLVDVEINEKELWKYIEKNYDLNDYDDIWDIDCEDVGRYADENCFNFVADKDFVKHLNDAWTEIKKQSDYMLTYDYAEYIAERLIEDNFLESKESSKKSSSIKESMNLNYEDFDYDELEPIADLSHKRHLIEKVDSRYKYYFKNNSDYEIMQFDDYNFAILAVPRGKSLFSDLPKFDIKKTYIYDTCVNNKDITLFVGNVEELGWCFIAFDKLANNDNIFAYFISGKTKEGAYHAFYEYKGNLILRSKESKKSARKSIKESKDIEIKVYFDGHTTPSNKYQDYNFSPYSRKYEISGLTEFKDDVTLTFERGKVKSLTYLGVTVDFDKKNNAKCDNWECEIDIDEIQEYIIKFSLRLFI